MPEILGPLIRVLLRYGGGVLVTKAGVTVDLTDPDIASLVELVAGALMAAAAEGWWYLSRKYGWGQ